MVAFNQEWHVEEERPIGDELPPVNPPADDGPKRRGAGRRSTAGRTTSGTTRRTAAARRPKKA